MKYYNLKSGTIHLRCQQIFHHFWPVPPIASSFLLLSVGKFSKVLTPPPKKCWHPKWMVHYLSLISYGNLGTNTDSKGSQQREITSSYHFGSWLPGVWPPSIWPPGIDSPEWSTKEWDPPEIWQLSILRKKSIIF